jgi:hypothetical protein
MIFDPQLSCRNARSKKETSMAYTSRTGLYCISALAFAVAGSSPLLAAEATQKVLAENEKVKVIDVVQKPGDTGPMTSRLGLVVHWVTGGTVERTYADGTKEVMNRKAGETALITEKRPYAVKNIGKTTTHLIEVQLK